MMKCSIICNTYNHEKTIELTINGFLIQSVNFSIEILIHDDASTDNTQKIVRIYEEMYPNLIKPIYQEVNQTSLGRSVSQINISRAQGEYIAICEGDDVWIDPYKLQKQVDYLDNHLDYVCVGHACKVMNVNFPYKSKIWSHSNWNKELSTQEIIRNRGIVFVYNTIVFKKGNYYYYYYPDFFNDFKVADVKSILFSSLIGKVYFMSDVMSIYHVGIKNSWTDRVRLNNDLLAKHYKDEIQFYEKLNVYTNHKFEHDIMLVNEQLSFMIKLLRSDKSCLNSINFINEKLYRKIIIYVQLYFPNSFLFLRKIRFRLWA